MEFNRRIKAPATNDKNWYSKKNPFYPTYVNNCTWYVWGRELELGVPNTELSKKLPTSNAENWYNDTKYSKFSYPRVGDIGCYRCGTTHKSSDGAGHVFIVEEVFDDGRIRISESGTNMKFQTRIIKPPYKYYLKSKYTYTFQGFIHLRDYDQTYWNPGDYLVLYHKYLRSSAEVKTNNKVKYNNLTTNAKAKCIKDALGYAKYKIDARINIKDMKYDTKGNLWGKTNTLWVCVNDSSGKQAKKV